MPKRSYAIWWNEGDGPRHAGKLELGVLHLLFSGNGAGRLAVPIDEVAEVDYAGGELTIRRRRAAAIRIGSLDAFGVLREVTDALTVMSSPPLPNGGP